MNKNKFLKKVIFFALISIASSYFQTLTAMMQTIVEVSAVEESAPHYLSGFNEISIDNERRFKSGVPQILYSIENPNNILIQELYNKYTSNTYCFNINKPKYGYLKYLDLETQKKAFPRKPRVNTNVFKAKKINRKKFEYKDFTIDILQEGIVFTNSQKSILFRKEKRCLVHEIAFHPNDDNFFIILCADKEFETMYFKIGNLKTCYYENYINLEEFHERYGNLRYDCEVTLHVTPHHIIIVTPIYDVFTMLWHKNPINLNRFFQ